MFFRNDIYNLRLPYPVHGPPPGRGLFIGFNIDRLDDSHRLFNILEYVVPRRDYNGIKVYFHDPFEVISEHAIVRHAKERSYIKFSILPKISTIDDSMRGVHINE
jgi:hypothetical protein